MTLTFDEDQTGSKSGELVVIDDEFATLASTRATALVAGARSAAINTTATTATSATTASSAFDEFIVVLASLEAKEIVVRSLGLGVENITTESGGVGGLELLLSFEGAGLLLAVELLVLSERGGDESALGGLLVQVVLESESNFFFALNLLGLLLLLASFSSFSAWALFLGLLSGCLFLLLGDLTFSLLYIIRSIAPVALSVAALLLILLTSSRSGFAVEWMEFFTSLADMSVLLVTRSEATSTAVISAFSTLGSSLLGNFGIDILATFSNLALRTSGSWAIATLLTASAAASATTATALAVAATASVTTALAIASTGSVTATTATAATGLLSFASSLLVVTIILTSSKSWACLGSLRLLHDNLLSLLGSSLLFLRCCSSIFFLLCKCGESVHIKRYKN